VLLRHFLIKRNLLTSLFVALEFLRFMFYSIIFNIPTKVMTTESNDEAKQRQEEEPHLPMNLIKSLNSSNKKDGGTSSSESGSSRSNGEGNGHQSDNSALVSVGNTSFGFNFDSEDGNSSPPNSERNGESDSDGGNGNGNSDARRNAAKKGEQVNPPAEQSADTPSPHAAASQQQAAAENVVQEPQHHQNSDSDPNSKVSSTQDPAPASSEEDAPTAPVPLAPGSSSHNIAADAAVANLYSIASAYAPQEIKGGDQKSDGKDNDSNGGYNTDDEGARGNSHIASLIAQHRASMTSNAASDDANNDDDDDEDEDDGRPRKKKRLNNRKREERNAREKERSFRISKQINELRALLSTGGVIVPKGTKSSVLTEAANYIRMLQQHQYRSEM
jgi:Helix-loop-helix DNA-binding domain